MFTKNLFFNNGSVSPSEYVVIGTQSSPFYRFTDTGTLLRSVVFSNGAGTPYIHTIAKTSDGIYLGGQFTTYLGTPSATAGDIVRTNNSLSTDTAFDSNPGTGTNTTLGIYAIAFDSTGEIYIGGDFTSWDSVTANRIIKLNTDGSKDTGFDNSTGFDEKVNAIAIDANGKILVGGAFTSYKGVTANRIIRLNSDGTKDTDFDNTTGFDGVVNTIAVTSSGSIYVGGEFLQYKGNSANRVIRLGATGSVDSGWTNKNFGGGFLGVTQIRLDSSNRAYVIGDFTSVASESYQYACRLDAAGDLDTGFATTTKFNNRPSALAISPTSGKIYFAGLFTSYNSETYTRAIRLNTDGTADSSFNTGSSVVNTPLSILVYT